jgi:hypothetical protein
LRLQFGSDRRRSELVSVEPKQSGEAAGVRGIEDRYEQVQWLAPGENKKVHMLVDEIVTSIGKPTPAVS